MHDQPCSSAASIAIAGLAIRVEFGSEALRKKIAPAFDHLLTSEAAEPQLTVFVREEASLFERAFSLPEVASARGENDFWLEEGPECSVILQRQGKFVSAVEWANKTAYWLVPDATSISYVDCSHPLHPLLIYWLGKKGRYVVHGAAVGNEKGGVLILGQNGAGKSTTALTCLEDGMLYVADDHCLVSLDEEPLAHSIYGTGKVVFEEMDRFPLLAPAAETRNRPEGEKTFYFLAGVANAHLVRCLRLRAILLARITAVPSTKLRAISQAEAFRTFAESCALHPPTTRAGALRILSRLVRQSPTFVLELGADLHSTPAVIRGLLERLSNSL